MKQVKDILCTQLQGGWRSSGLLIVAWDHSPAKKKGITLGLVTEDQLNFTHQKANKFWTCVEQHYTNNIPQPQPAQSFSSLQNFRYFQPRNSRLLPELRSNHIQFHHLSVFHSPQYYCGGWYRPSLLCETSLYSKLMLDWWKWQNKLGAPQKLFQCPFSLLPASLKSAGQVDIRKK